ncbi:MAG: 3'-5' exoribonuclease [Sandaracinus sp.]|nr:3'-5' exoribonuclease [Sandaracinus sp.]MCB9621149.1 3'-5' exoribonuclease [Sandaracinus sp.]
MARKETYVSVDVETDGPIPGPCSMLSIGAAAYDERGELLGTFSANLETLDGAVGDEKTLAWWKTQPEAWAACRTDLRDPAEAMHDFTRFLDALPGSPVFVAYPAGFDFTFVYWYLVCFTGKSPFSHSALDLKTLAMAAMKRPYRESVKRNMPRGWFSPTRRHAHVALDDALEQGELFVSIARELGLMPR